MTEQPGGKDPVSKLQPLDFRLILDDGVAAVYQAVTVNYELPQVPVYTVTLTIASAVLRQAGEQLQAFLSEMRAAFELTPAPEPDDGPPDDEEPFDINTQMQIELNLASVKGDGPVGVVAVVETSIGSEQAMSASYVGDAAVTGGPQPYRIPPGGRDQYWWAYCNRKLTLTVTPTIGYGTIRSPQKNVSVGNPGSLTARQVIVASRTGMSYRAAGSFSGPHGGPRNGKPC